MEACVFNKLNDDIEIIRGDLLKSLKLNFKNTIFIFNPVK